MWIIRSCVLALSTRPLCGGNSEISNVHIKNLIERREKQLHLSMTIPVRFENRKQYKNSCVLRTFVCLFVCYIRPLIFGVRNCAPAIENRHAILTLLSEIRIEIGTIDEFDDIRMIIFHSRSLFATQSWRKQKFFDPERKWGAKDNVHCWKMMKTMCLNSIQNILILATAIFKEFFGQWPTSLADSSQFTPLWLKIDLAAIYYIESG